MLRADPTYAAIESSSQQKQSPSSESTDDNTNQKLQNVSSYYIISIIFDTCSSKVVI